MTEAQILDLTRDALWTALMMATPLLAAALTVGLAIGLFQALTSIQEMTLTFAPKVGAMLVVFWVSMGFMTDMLVDFFQDRILPLIAGG